MFPYRYSISCLLSGRDLKNWIRYARQNQCNKTLLLDTAVKLCLLESSRPLLALLCPGLHFCIFHLVNLVSTSPSFKLINCTPSLQAPDNKCTRHCMVKRDFGGENNVSFLYFYSSASLRTQRLPPPSLFIPKIFASAPKLSTTYITDLDSKTQSVSVVHGIPM